MQVVHAAAAFVLPVSRHMLDLRMLLEATHATSLSTRLSGSTIFAVRTDEGPLCEPDLVDMLIFEY